MLNRFKGPIIVGVLVFFAFVWGFKKDSILAVFTNLNEAEPAPEVEPPPAPPARQTPRAGRPSAPPAPRNQSISTGPNQGLNAYQQFLMGSQRTSANERAGQGASLEKTFDSINRGGIEETQKVRRNAYFEKLSQQLRELRGETPPAPSNKTDNDKPSRPEPEANVARDTLPEKGQALGEPPAEAAPRESESSAAELPAEEDEPQEQITEHSLSEEEAALEELEELEQLLQEEELGAPLPE